jgi:hypothetical protein
MHALGMRPARGLIGVVPDRSARLMSIVGIALLTGFGFSSTGFASERTISTASGESVIIGRHTQWRKDCTPDGLPSIKIEQEPANGAASVAAGTNTVGRNRINPENKECVGKQMPGVILTYQPKADFTGTDTVSYTVILRSNHTYTDTVTINVLPSLKAASQNTKKIESASVAADPADAVSPRTLEPASEALKSTAPIDTPPPKPKAASIGVRIALVIGNSAYTNVPALPNPRRDADSISAALRSVGFKTVLLRNDLTREKLTDALQSFAAEAEKADWAVVYFAGHGVELNGTNYLIPVDARLATDRDVEFEAVPLDRVMSAVGGAKRLRLVMLDACRDNPFISQMRRSVATRSIGRGLTSVEPEPERSLYSRPSTDRSHSMARVPAARL